MFDGYTCVGCGCFVLTGSLHVCPLRDDSSTGVPTVFRTNTGGTEIARLEREVAELRQEVEKLKRSQLYRGEYKESKR